MKNGEIKKKMIKKCQKSEWKNNDVKKWAKKRKSKNEEITKKKEWKQMLKLNIEKFNSITISKKENGNFLCKCKKTQLF